MPRYRDDGDAGGQRWCSRQLAQAGWRRYGMVVFMIMSLPPPPPQFVMETVFISRNGGASVVSGKSGGGR